MQHCSGPNAASDATWQSSQANATARTRRRIAVMSEQSNGTEPPAQIALVVTFEVTCLAACALARLSAVREDAAQAGGFQSLTPHLVV